MDDCEHKHLIFSDTGEKMCKDCGKQRYKEMTVLCTHCLSRKIVEAQKNSELSGIEYFCVACKHLVSRYLITLTGKKVIYWE